MLRSKLEEICSKMYKCRKGNTRTYGMKYTDIKIRISDFTKGDLNVLLEC